MNYVPGKFRGTSRPAESLIHLRTDFSGPGEERRMTPPSAPDPADAAPDEGTPVTGLTAAQAYELVAGGRGVLVDTRDRRLFDNAHAAGALSLPLTILEAGQGHAPVGVLPP